MSTSKRRTGHSLFHHLWFDEAGFIDPEMSLWARCPAGVLSVGGRLKLQICYHLLGGTRRFGELQRLIPEASRQMLTMQLRDLEQIGLIHRQAYPQVPPKVEYSLTEQGGSFVPALQQLNAWGEQMGIGF